jgi:hypothetical protein
MWDWEKRDRNYWGERTNPNTWVYPAPVCCQDGPTRYNRKMLRGDSLYFLNTVWINVQTQQLFTIPVTSPLTPSPPNSVPFNLTGCEIWFTAKNNIPDPDLAAVIELNNMSLGGITVTSATGGAITGQAAPSLTFQSADSVVRLKTDIQVKDSTSRVSTVEVGYLDIWPDITRATT